MVSNTPSPHPWIPGYLAVMPIPGGEGLKANESVCFGKDVQWSCVKKASKVQNYDVAHDFFYGQNSREYFKKSILD